MLKQAEEKKVYKELHELFLGKPESFPDQFKNKFDIVTGSGILCEGHVSTRVLEEMLLALKQGGYAIFTCRTVFLTELKISDKVKELDDAGKWKKVEEWTFEKNEKLKEAVGRFYLVEGKCFAYQKL